MKKFFFVLFTTILVFSNSNHVFASSVSLTYDVVNSNETPNLWYNSDFSEFFPYLIPIGSKISINSDDYESTFNTHDITVGNLSRNSIPMSESTNNLVIGHYLLPEMGFFLNSSFTEASTKINTVKSLFNETSITEVNAEYVGETKSTVQYYLKDSFQESTFIYDKDTGVLLSAKSSVLQYSLEIVLIEASGLNARVDLIDTISESLPFLLSFMNISILLLFSYYIKRRKIL